MNMSPLQIFWLFLLWSFGGCTASFMNVQESTEALSKLVLPPVQLRILRNYIVIKNGILSITLSNPDGHVVGIQYKGIDNLLELQNSKDLRGYWDLVWGQQITPAVTTIGKFNAIGGTNIKVIVQNDEQVEVSFTSIWDHFKADVAPLNTDKRYIMLRGSSGFYSYAIYEHLKGFPAFLLDETRIAFKLKKDMFHYMAVADNRQRYMPLPEDREPPHGQPLAYREAVRLVNPIELSFKGEVDDKYQYSANKKDIDVHGWICKDPAVGFWQITPSSELRLGGPLKQYLTSHVGPTVLANFLSPHYAGEDFVRRYGANEPWKQVFGPVFMYINSAPAGKNPLYELWENAKLTGKIEAGKWPYSFPASRDFPKSNQRGNVKGRLLVRDRALGKHLIPAKGAYVGLATPGEAGSWQRESKNYQFWTQADNNGYFFVNHSHSGFYNIFAWVPGFIGDYRYDRVLHITGGGNIDVGNLVYEPPRDGPTLWEIGVADRTAWEFFVPDPNPLYVNKLFINHTEKFRQYGLWERYADLYPDKDLVFTIGVSDHTKDWFYAHVPRKIGKGNSFKATTWQIKFKLAALDKRGIYKLRLAIASATYSTLRVRVNNPNDIRPLFTTGMIGHDNAIARHAIHGTYWLYNVDIPGISLFRGDNTIYLTQASAVCPLQGIMYDHIRLESPPPF